MHHPFFPGPVFGWTFFAVLSLVMVLAAGIDLRRMTIPKWLTLSALSVGVLFNIVRGAWLGAEGDSVWLLGDDVGALLGAVDGLLFSVVGFIVGFLIFFAMWMIRVCGGGDVKLFAALGAWLGPYYAFLVLVITLLVILTQTLALIAGSLFSGKFRMAAYAKPQKKKINGGPRPGSQKRALTFALPLAIATVLVLLWCFRVDFGLAAAPSESSVQVQRHG